MKLILMFTVFVFAQNSFALDVTFKLKAVRKQPVTSRMSCIGQTCTCPVDTVLDSDQMRCIKCEEGLELDANQKCVIKNAPSEHTVRGWTAISPEVAEMFKAEERSSPSLCDVRTAVDGKFSDCQCPDANLGLELDASSKLVVVIKKTFKRETQMCERSQPYTVMVQDISCRGPRRGAFEQLETLGLVKDNYVSPGMSLAMCGATDGVHNIQIQKSENMRSVLDAISLTITSSPRNIPAIESFKIDPQTLNY